jgi:acetyl/propionyl-CoA carboxylase alpha subunit
MLDEIDDRRHSRTDRSKWIREAIEARLNAEDSGEWDEYAPDGGELEEANSTEVSTRADV